MTTNQNKPVDIGKVHDDVELAKLVENVSKEDIAKVVDSAIVEEKEEQAESAKENAESSEIESKEVAGGTEVPIPEEFQKQVQALLKGANKQQLRHVQDCCNECLNGMNKEEEFSTKEMPE